MSHNQKTELHTAKAMTLFVLQGDVKTFRDYVTHTAQQDFEVTEEVGKVIERIYKSNAAQKCLNFRHQIDILDSAV